MEGIPNCELDHGRISSVLICVSKVRLLNPFSGLIQDAFIQ